MHKWGNMQWSLLKWTFPLFVFCETWPTTRSSQNSDLIVMWLVNKRSIHSSTFLSQWEYFYTSTLWRKFTAHTVVCICEGEERKTVSFAATGHYEHSVTPYERGSTCCGSCSSAIVFCMLCGSSPRYFFGLWIWSSLCALLTCWPLPLSLLQHDQLVASVSADIPLSLLTSTSVCVFQNLSQLWLPIISHAAFLATSSIFAPTVFTDLLCNR